MSVAVALTTRVPNSDALRQAAKRQFHNAAERAASVEKLRRWAPAPAAAQTVTAWAAAHGLHVDQVGHWIVSLSAAPETLAHAFDVRLVRDRSFYEPMGPARYLRAATPPAVPAALHSAASAVIGLDERPLLRSHATGADGYQPGTLRSAYTQVGGATAGTGITVGTVQFAAWRPSVLTTWATDKGIANPSARVTTVSVNGATSTCTAGTCPSGEVEVALDTEAILAAAPMASQRVYVGANTAPGILATYNAMADDAEAGLVQVASSSWGTCELTYTSQGSGGLTLLSNLRTAVQRLVGAGSTLFAATGDFGSDDCYPSSNDAVDVPSSFPETIATGATALASSTLPTYDPDETCTTGFCEYGWGDGTPAHGASGGGNSAVYARPSYQSAVLPAAGTKRMVPDISAVGDPHTGVSTYSAGLGWRIIGGTSASAPLNAGMLAAALWNQGITAGVGDLHGALYNAPSGDFRDAISGAYGGGSGDNGTFVAGVGYDRVTGLGSPLWQALVPDLDLQSSTYHTLPSPLRVLDTRTAGGGGVIVSKGVRVLNLSASPASLPAGTSAAVLNVTITAPTKSGYVTAFPGSGGKPPTASNVNFAAGATIANLVTVQLRTDRKVSFYNGSAGTVHVVADLAGYYRTGTSESTYNPLDQSVRVIETREAYADPSTGPAGAVPANTAYEYTVPASVGAADTSTANAFVLNVTVVAPQATGNLRVYPGTPGTPPTVSNLNFTANKTVPNLVTVGTEANSVRTVSFFNASAGTVHLVVDLAGYFTPATTASVFHPVSPRRVMDTRNDTGGVGTGPIGAQAVQALSLPAWIPVGVTAVIMNVTVTQPTSSGYLTVFPGSGTPPTASNLNFVAGETRANLAVVSVDASRVISFKNGSAGTVHALADVAGYYTPPPLP
jgi:subtilase family serine protease